jgi:hypothetical protein
VVRIHAGEPNSQFASRPTVLLFFSMTFLVRMAQPFERLEQGRLQCSVLPSRLCHNHLEQSTLLAARLLEEQFARSARKAQHVDRFRIVSAKDRQPQIGGRRTALLSESRYQNQNWYVEESKDFTGEVSARIMDAFFTSLATELGVDFDGPTPFTSRGIDWRTELPGSRAAGA